MEQICDGKTGGYTGYAHRGGSHGAIWTDQQSEDQGGYINGISRNYHDNRTV